jgi:hypothetical protein
MDDLWDDDNFYYSITETPAPTSTWFDDFLGYSKDLLGLYSQYETIRNSDGSVSYIPVNTQTPAPTGTYTPGYSTGTQITQQPKNNTLLYVGLGVAAVIGLVLVLRKK